MTRGPRGEHRPADLIGCAVTVARIATGETGDSVQCLSGRVRSGTAGAGAQNKVLTKEQRVVIAQKAAHSRWS